jgi:hypothetical protein
VLSKTRLIGDGTTTAFFYKTYQQNNQTSTIKTDSEIQALRVDKPNKHVHVDEIRSRIGHQVGKLWHALDKNCNM